MSATPSENPYAAPVSNLQEAAVAEQVPSIEEALSRGYDFQVGALISESWRLVASSKGILIGGFLLYYAAIMLVNTVLGFVLSLVGLEPGEDNLVGMFTSQFAIGILGSVLTYPLLAGLMLVGIRRAAGQEINFNQIFLAFNNPIPVIITGILMSVMVYAGMLLLLLPGIYLAFAYTLALPLVLERGLSPWQALETSRKAISQHWFKVFGWAMLLGLIILLSAIPLGIGLVWTMPMWMISTGILYRTIFGVLPAAA
jgi:hypothetical protein